MIIKTLSRKTGTFKSFLDYIDKGVEEQDKDFIIEKNLWARNQDEYARQFEENYNLTRKHKNSVKCYHEIISFHELDTVNLNHEKIKDLIDKWISVRANKALVYGRIHRHNKNIHVHLCVSSNNLREKKKNRINKKEYDNCKKDLENYQIERYPELINSVAQQREQKTKRTLAEQEILKKAKIPVKEKIKYIIEQCQK